MAFVVVGAEAGARVSAVGIRKATRTPHGAHLELVTDAPSVTPVALEITRLEQRGVALDLRAAAGLGVISTMFTLASPSDEGLYGLGTRRDAFDQRGLLRNVWVEEQYLGYHTTEGITGADPTQATGPAYTFPNGARSAFFVTPELSGSRGWTAWTDQTPLGRLDLAASRPYAIRSRPRTPTYRSISESCARACAWSASAAECAPAKTVPTCKE